MGQYFGFHKESRQQYHHAKDDRRGDVLQQSPFVPETDRPVLPHQQLVLGPLRWIVPIGACKIIQY